MLLFAVSPGEMPAVCSHRAAEKHVTAPHGDLEASVDAVINRHRKRVLDSKWPLSSAKKEARVKI